MKSLRNRNTKNGVINFVFSIAIITEFINDSNTGVYSNSGNRLFSHHLMIVRFN